MSIFDNILFIEEKAWAVTYRFTEFKKYFADATLRPQMVQKLTELKCWPLVRDNEIDPDESKVL